MNITDPIDNSKHTYLDMNKRYIDMTGSTATGPQYFAPQTDATTVCKDMMTPSLVRDPNNQQKHPQTNMDSVVQASYFFQADNLKVSNTHIFERRLG